MRHLPYLLLAAVLLLTACTASDQSSDSADARMADFTDDPAFVDQHEVPTAITPPTGGKNISFAVQGGDDGQAYYVSTAANSDRWLLVFHEWWGLNDHIRREAERLAADLAPVHVLALDLYDGEQTDDPDKAGALMKDADEARIQDILAGAIAYAGPEARFGTIGWCFGGGWSLRAAITAGPQADACVMYYGMPVQKADELAALQAPVLGLFAQSDGWVTPEVATKFEQLAAATSKSVRIEQYDAQHAFANPSGPRYDSEAAAAANAEALAFLRQHL